mmetsp:Transcript_19375/g.43301  ORF Transcript_19375/g.43301 Transcript_19375/m.43301 type:complete len:180 (-) Transcript_19375:451-990(-)|eukprot:CAMPEP_0181195584 /NCGR_PEP_ID=MMETSP1096-20121128/14971_1 /TAXON_ID=156174 ORGANISM="Chrysochromulina ericina, Strain CCMP281" /NCGR_SAMPLE_ID=MMETSP1096 /ASSEMBLY_ACC=CAM_ASM_000453 /LENGTH=179 /DNA_ID=CAMNT_0023285209 /DNA_START=266 /DNA_END=805 /DNA_ORIENTATION=-
MRLGKAPIIASVVGTEQQGSTASATPPVTPATPVPAIPVLAVPPMVPSEPTLDDLAPGDPSQPERPLQRMLSMRSQETVNTLDEIEQQLLAMKVKSDEADTMFSSPPPEGLPSSMRNTLAQLHGDANRLLATRIDAILTSELNSGKDDARAKRKQLIGVTESLIDRVEGQVKQYDKLKG